MKTLVAIVCVLFVSSCANYTVETNIDRTKINEYFAPAAVKVFQDEIELPAARRFLGAIEGESCQVRTNLPVATFESARAKLKRKASDIGANAIIVTSCAPIEVNGCLSAKLCYAKAFLVGN